MPAFTFGSMPSDGHKKTQFFEETGFFILTSTMAVVSRIASLFRDAIREVLINTNLLFRVSLRNTLFINLLKFSTEVKVTENRWFL